MGSYVSTFQMSEDNIPILLEHFLILTNLECFTAEFIIAIHNAAYKKRQTVVLL